jgi:hypothetical protein
LRIFAIRPAMGQLYAPAVVSPTETPELLPRRREAAQKIDF